MTIPAVAHTAEFQRVASLPRRVWNEADLASLASSLTEIFRTPPDTPCVPVAGDRAFRESKGLCLICGQPLRLNHVQALALHDAGTEGGLFGGIGVGEGKTLISFFLSVAMGAERPLLLEPGGLVEKTQRDRLALSAHWKIPNDLRVFSYDVLGRVEAKNELEEYQPDLLILEEGHRAKNKRAARTRVIARYMHAHPTTKVAVLSGTIMDKSIKDFSHLALWALKWGAPIPTSNEEIEEWAEALDEGVDPLARRRAGALLEFATEAERAGEGGMSETVAARRGFRRRLTETPGVVCTIGEGEHVDCSIYVRGIRHKVSPQTEWNFLHLRGDNTPEHPGWQTPDDWELMSGVDVWRHAQELALGLFYVWDPRPPMEWREARKEWHRFVRDKISQSRTYDSELHVANACDAGILDATALNAWREIEPTFTPNVEAVWCDDEPLKACAAWMKAKPGLVWTGHGFFAERLAALTGAPYYGAGGFTADGRYIEDAPPGSSAIASIDANREGKNLQKLWSRNLFVCPPSSAQWWEQTIARTHRTGQEADEVIVDVMLGCRENFDACMKALASAQAVHDTTGKTQKLLLADVTLPSEQEIDALRSPRWQK